MSESTSPELEQAQASITALESKRNELLAELKTAKKRISELEGEAEALRASSEAGQRSVERVLVSNVIDEFCREHVVPGAAPMIQPHLEKSLRLKTGDDGLQTVDYLSPAGDVLTREEWTKSVCENEAFASAIIGSRASGGGAGCNQSLPQRGKNGNNTPNYSFK